MTSHLPADAQAVATREILRRDAASGRRQRQRGLGRLLQAGRGVGGAVRGLRRRRHRQGGQADRRVREV